MGFFSSMTPLISGDMRLSYAAKLSPHIKVRRLYMWEWIKTIGSMISPIGALREQLSAARAQISDLTRLIGEQNAEIQNLKFAVSDKDNQIKELKKSLDGCNEKLREATQYFGHLEPPIHPD